MADAILPLLCPKVDARLGSPLGRATRGREAFAAEGPFYLRKVPLVQGYDPGGVYWGEPSDLYGYVSGDGAQYGFFRAADRGTAIAALKQRHPNAKLKGRT